MGHRQRVTEPDLLFYDGTCGLCHRAVLFLLRRDPAGLAFRFAPLYGETYLRRVGGDARADLPDSLLVIDPAGHLYTRSGGTVRLLQRLGGPWRVLGGALAWLPRPLRDGGYDLIAKLRRRVFPAPKGVCPRVPPDLQARFLP